MLTNRALNVNDAYVQGMTLLAANNVLSDSRTGAVLVCPEPVTTHYAHPRQRVLFHPARDANPFFHLTESLWMLAGDRDVALPAYFVPKMAEYSDDGTTFHAAYGYRWRKQWGFDQLGALISELSQDPLSRRAVLALWHPSEDLGWDSKDLPCNTTAVFDRRTTGGALNLTVFCRSNDIIMGCYGANAVQWSMLLEYMAGRIGCPVGWYEQVSTNFHAYQRDWLVHWPTIPAQHRRINPYLDGQRPLRAPVDLVGDPETIDAEICEVVDAIRRQGNITGRSLQHLRSPLLRTVVAPMVNAYRVYRAGSPKQAASYLEHAITEHGSCDWLEAGFSWMARRARRGEG